MSKRVRIIFEPISKRIWVNQETTIFDALKSFGLAFDAPCGGAGTCGKCKIKIESDQKVLSSPTANEIKLLSSAELSDGIRLACQAKVLDNVKITLSDEFFNKDTQILSGSSAKRELFEQRYFEQEIFVPDANLEDLINDNHRFIESFASHIKIQVGSIRPVNFSIVRSLSIVLRKKSGKVWVKYRINNDKSIDILDIHNGESTGVYGLAVDLGTTTIVGYLYDLIKGDLIGQSAMLNPQVSIGEDVVSRLTHISQQNSLARASGLAKKGINEIIHSICKESNIDPSSILEIDIVGNTAMHHIFFELPTNFMAVSPYVPVIQDSIYVSNSKIHLGIHDDALVYSPPVIAGYVGADTVGCIEATHFPELDELTMMLDIGTNGEIVIGNKEIGMYTGSVAAGSALEGAHLSSGMRASGGSIEKIKIDTETLEPSIQAIGNKSPIGICGSGIIDMVAELLRSNIISRSGRFSVKNQDLMKHPRIEQSGRDVSYIVHSPELPAIDKNTGSPIETKKGVSVKFNQNDVREFQKAKGAFLSGAYLIHEQIPDSFPNQPLESIVIAGAFGNYIDKENARFVGLFPDIDLEKIVQVGNAAGLGAQNMLLNNSRKTYAEKHAHYAKHVQIALIKSFQKVYAESMIFPHMDIKKFPSIADLYNDIPLR